MNKGSFLALRLASCAVIFGASFLHTFTFAQTVSACGNPRAKVDFTTYDPAIAGNGGANAWSSLTLGNKAIIPEGQFFDVKDGTYAIDDGPIVTTGLQNFAVSRHDGYIEFLALGRRLPAYYGYYQGTIKFENIQVDRVEGGLTTASWADIGLETTTEGDTATKVSDTEVSFKLAFANQGDGFRVYLKNPTSTPCNCPTGQTKAPDPKSPVCIVRALVKGVQDTDFILTGYDHLVGNCTLAAGSPQPPQAPSSQITVAAGEQRTSWLQGSPNVSQLGSLLTCPTGTTKTACMFTYGAGPLGEITCGCYRNENTATPKNLSCRTFSDPIIHGRPVFARDASPAQFCREQGYTQSATVITEYDYLNVGSLWNGSVWETNNHLAAIHEVSCCKLEDKPNDICAVASCTGSPTLKSGSSLTDVMNAQGEAFSTNAQCAGKQISLAPCSSTPGVIPAGTSTDGNSLYLWSKTASNLSQDYTLVDIKGQCWFADNLQENPSLWPSPVGTWDNYAPHNGYGRYDFGTPLPVSRAEGYLYQFDSGTNNSAAGGAPAERLQGACPTGWHVATDCEFQFVEHVYGMTVAEQQTVGARSSGTVGTDLKTGGTSGFDMPLSGARRWNTGFINGLGEGHLWSSECTASGCYKRIVDNTGAVRRLVGDGGAYDSSHHAAGSIRCVKDGNATAAGTCPGSCQAGQYWCNSENACKPAGQSCGALTCNNNNICDTGESCNCGDCTNGGTDDRDRCGLTSTGAQMICTKDKQNTTTPGGFDSTTAQANFDIVNGKLATYLSAPGNLNVAAGEFGSTATELTITQDSQLTYFSSFTQEEAWTRAKELLAIPTSAQVLWSKKSVKYENDALGDNERYLYSYVVEPTPGVRRQILFATEYLPSLSLGWRKVYLIGKEYSIPQTGSGTVQVGACCPVGTQWSSTANACLTDKCAEGQYYCHEELKCKPANQPCSAVVCEDKVVFKYTGAVQNYTVPADVSKIQIKAWGAAGGSGTTPWIYTGAAGGYAQGDIGVTGGEQFKIVVGEGGKRASTLRTFGGGGHGTSSWGGSGGGLSGVFRNSFTHANSLLIAGGGAGVAGGGSGSTGDNNALGFGGGLVGNNGFIDLFGNGFAQGGTQTAGGTAVSLRHSSLSGTSGGPLSGGDASMTTCYSGGGGGGGGGYYGGGGGLGDWCTFPTAGDTDGGGGSGYLHTSLSNASFTTATTTDPKTAPKKTDTDYIAGAGEGKNTGDGSGGNGLVVITECRPKPTATCNNNGTCDTNESCDCADCNEKIDHCGLDTNGSQLICTKDTSPVCYTDKFPYCLPACLDGYTRNASGQCVSTVTTNSAAPFSCTIRRGTGTETATVACNAGEIRVGGGCANTGSGASYRYTNFPILGGQAPVGYPSVTSDGWACATGSTGTYNDAYAVCCTNAGDGITTVRKVTHAIAAQVECNAGEVRVGGGCENASGGAYTYWNMPMSAGDNLLSAVGYGAAARDGWICHSGSSGNTITAYAICRTSTATSPLANVVVKKGTSTSGSISCDAGQKLIGGGYQNSGDAYGWVSLPMYTGNSITNSFWTHTATQDQYFATSGSSGTSLTAYALCASDIPTTGKTPYAKTITLSGTSGNNNVLFEKIATLPPGEYNFSGSGTSYNDGGGGTNMVFFSKRDLTTYTSVSLAQDGVDLTKYWAATGACPEVVYYQGIQDPNIIYAVKRCGYETKQWSIPANTKIVSNETVYVYRYMSQSAVNGTIQIDGFSTTASCYTPPANYTPPATPPALPATAKYHQTSLLSNGTVNTGIDGYLSQPFPCDNCYYVGPKTGQPNPITFKIPSTAGLVGKGKYYAFDIINNSYFINMCFDNVNIKISFDNQVEHSLISNRIIINSWGMRIIPDLNKPGYGWVGQKKSNTYDRMNLILDKNNANYENWKYIKLPNEVKFDYQGTVTDHCPGSVGTGGGWMYYYGFIADSDFDASKINTSSLPLCQTSTPTPQPVLVPIETQLGACCPPGSAWNSVENRCVPSTCGVGQFYCAAQKKCLPGGTTCDTTVCNNNGLCEGEESCQCGDCVDGPTQTDPAKKADDKDKCSIIGGTQAMCSDDLPNDNKPGACCLPPQTWNTATGTCQECTNTQAPSELKAGVDQPYISCTGNGDTTQTHFKYRLTKVSGTPSETPYISPTPTPVGTQVLHTATSFTEGSYKVECFYGTASNVPTDTLSTPHTCTKTIAVKTGTVQGCDALITHKDSLLTSLLHDANPFSASSRCASRTFDDTLTQPFRLFYGNAAPITLEYDSVFAMLEIVGLSVPNFHSFTTGNTDIRCAVKVGGGYSTNSACFKTACVGGTCSLPQTFSVVNSANHTCTTEDKSVYDIGCNPLADQTTKDTCAKWFSDAFARNALTSNTFTTHFTFGGADTPIVCTKYPPGGLPGGLNMYANFVCKALLPNGEEVEIYGAEDNGTPIKALQTTAYTTKKDNQVPTLREIDYYSSESLSPSSRISAPTRWQKTNVTAVVTCADAPGVSDGDTCACAPSVTTTSTTPDLWSPGTPDATVGADIMRYTRLITSSLNGASVSVRDTAGNISVDSRTISVGVDTVAPTVNITTTGTAPSLAVTITATDNTGGSGIWKDNIQTQTYLATAPVPTFDDKCNLTSSDALLYETYSPTGTPLALTKSTAAPITLNTSTHKLAYCIQDNAGNVTKGFYPSVPVACFSSSNLPTVPGTTPAAVPALPTYIAPLLSRIAPTTGVGQFGYGMSTDATSANCFRGIITSNVTRLIANQYNASTATTVDWSTPAKIKTNPTQSNTNGYYYHTAMTSNLLTINTNPTGTGPKVVYAEGADIQINTDINYRDPSTATNPNTLLIIIAKRATTGTNPAGGNIYINPSVKNIDAILITDGAIMNGTNGTPKDYVTNPTELINRLTINGRIYSMNTRGGSINPTTVTSNNLGMISTNTGKVFANNASLTTNATPAQAAAQDLERFRVINEDGNTQCSLFINYKTIPINTLPPILQRPSGYTGGSCGF